MDTELHDLLERAKSVKPTPEEIDESNTRMAVANGLISDNRITFEVMRAVETVNKASVKSAT